MFGPRSLRQRLAFVSSMMHGERLERKKKKPKQKPAAHAEVKTLIWSHILNLSPSCIWSTDSGLYRNLSAYFYSTLWLHLLKVFGNNSSLKSLTYKATRGSNLLLSVFQRAAKGKVCWGKVPPVSIFCASSKPATDTYPTVWFLLERPSQLAVMNGTSVLQAQVSLKG